MSSHRTAYAALKDEKNYQQIGKIEEVLNTRQYYYIPKAEVKNIEGKLQDGDIIAITTGIQGLDVVHVGFAKRHNNRIHLLHASLDEKKVVISSKPLAEYLIGNKNQSGIMVARAVNR
jgi:choline kinase